MVQFKHLTLLPLMLSNVIAQSSSWISTSLIFGPWDVKLSVIGADATATTYLEDNSDPSRNNTNTKACNAEAYDRLTVVNGPSTAAVTVVYTECGTNKANSYHYNCPLTEPNTATCTYVAAAQNETETGTETQNSSELSPQPCTITAGIEKLIAWRLATTTTTSTSSTGRPSSTEPTPGPQTTGLQPTSSTTATTTASTTASSAAARDKEAPLGKVLVAVAGAFLAGL